MKLTSITMDTGRRRWNSPLPTRRWALPLVCLVACAWLFAAGPLARRAPAQTGLIRKPYLQWLTQNSVFIVWDTGEEMPSRLAYRPVAAPGGAWQETSVARPVRHHVVQLTGLQAGRYEYAIQSESGTLATATFATAKPPGVPFSFAVWGDSGEGTKDQRRLAERIDAAKPDFMLHSGDLIYDRGEPEGFDPRFFSVYAPTLMRAPFYGSLGNHDIKTNNGKPFLDNFIFPPNGPRGLEAERNYSVDFGDAHCVIIDSNLSEEAMRRDLAPWLERDLKASKARWKFAVFHHPPYSSAAHGDTPRTKRVLAPIFSRCKVDVVFNGHDHSYERFKPIGGVVYVVTGAGGAKRYKRHQFNDITASFYNDNWSFTQIEVDGKTLRGRQININGAVVDYWHITKP